MEVCDMKRKATRSLRGSSKRAKTELSAIGKLQVVTSLLIRQY